MSRSRMDRRAPAAASRRAVASPNPLPPPVITACDEASSTSRPFLHLAQTFYFL
jgi:hypothetical protein